MSTHSTVTTSDQVDPHAVGQQLADSFASALDLPRRFLPWVQAHAAAIEAARALLESTLTTDITAAACTARTARQTELTPCEWCDLLAHQVEELRELEGADPDIAEPDRQARTRLVTIAGLAIAFIDRLDRHAAVNGAPHELVGAVE